jgi:protein SCO1/2
MQYLTRKILASLAAMALIAVALLYFEGAFSRKSTGSMWGANYFPNVVLTDQHGTQVRLYDDLLKGKAVAVNTFFAGCGDVCPLGTAKMLELKKLLGERVGKDVFFYSISVDPHNDTPKAMKAYADRFSTGPGWRFLTGKEEDVALAIKKLGLGTLRPTAPRDNHSTSLMVGHEPSGQWMKQSVTDNPRFVAASMQTFLGWEELLPGSQSYAKAKLMQGITNGQFLFNNGCSSCHTIGGGDKIGPDLAGVTQRRDRKWLEHFILVPDEVLAAGDPIATGLLAKYKGVVMPNLGLARDEVAGILEFIDQRTADVGSRKQAQAQAHDSHVHQPGTAQR